MQIISHKAVRRTMIVACAILFSIFHIHAQTIFQYNILADVELSKGGEKSHFYYNEIDQDNIDWRLGMSQLNVLGKLSPNNNLSFNFRLTLERENGQKLKKLSTPQLNLQWLSNRRKVGITVGQFVNPFGSFNEKQLSTDRNFVGLPLMYSYYVNISPNIGFLPAMGDVTKVPVDEMVQWGSSGLYYGGYTAGAMLSWNVKPGKVNWKLALVNGASNKIKRFTEPLNLGFISKLKLRPTYYWEQGLSISHGSFMQESEVSDQLESLGKYTQTIIGTDFKLGKGFFEVSGELIGAFYKVPQFNDEVNSFEGDPNNEPLNVSSYSAYLDVKYEIPTIQGSYVAVRFDYLGFGNLEGSNSQNWDNNVTRQSLAIGYHITRNILARIAVSTQQVDDKPWNKKQGTFRFVLTAHY
ncbi:MAG: hypothetical protein HKN68_19135 [Saprospiraceae bacterium]|nr:hypothetical protein [Saprospiraceae bacterium]